MLRLPPRRGGRGGCRDTARAAVVGERGGALVVVTQAGTLSPPNIIVGRALKHGLRLRFAFEPLAKTISKPSSKGAANT